MQLESSSLASVACIPLPCAMTAAPSLVVNTGCLDEGLKWWRVTYLMTLTGTRLLNKQNSPHNTRNTNTVISALPLGKSGTLPNIKTTVESQII